MGSILSGVVTGIEDYGAFVSIAGMDGVNGLVFKDEVSWGKIITVDSMLKIGGLGFGDKHAGGVEKMAGASYRKSTCSSIDRANIKL